MSIAQNFPEIAPSLNLDFANVGALDPRVSFSRASSATYYGTETAKAEENLLTFSQEFDNTTASGWAKTNVDILENSATAPDQTSTAETVTDNATDAAHLFVQNINSVVVSSQNYALSVFLKAGTLNFATLAIRDSASSQRFAGVVVDLSAGTVSQTFNGTSGTLVSSSITALANDWYRCVIVANVASTGNLRFSIGMASAASGNTITSLGTISYVGTGSTIFAWGAQLEQRSAVTAYTPTTTQPITRYQPVLETASANVARFDHDPLTFESLGLLVEEQRTNLLLRSEEFDDAGWIKTRSSITANTIVAPDGTLTGDKLVEDTSLTTTHFTQQLGVGTIIAGATVTYSIFVKSGERTDCSLLVRGDSFGDRFEAIFNLVTGVVRSTNAAGTGSVAGATINPVGNEWYRLTVTGVSGSANTTCEPRIQTANSFGNPIYTGDGFSGIYIWGAQLESGAFPTSYIKTVASQVTRAADAASMTGANFSSFYNQAEGTVYVEASTTVSSPKISLSNNTTSNRLLLDVTTTSVRLLVTTNGSTEASPVIAYQSGFVKMAAFFKTNSFNIAQNGTLGTLDTLGAMPLVDRMYIGGGSLGTVIGVNHFKKIAYLPKESTATQLQALTSV